jgi:lipopolysaccharide transport system permease protein
LAACWLLSALGVYLRDTNQLVSVMLSALMFMSAIFYPLSALPIQWQPVLALNPIVPVIEQTREVLIAGHAPSAKFLLIGTILAAIGCEVSYRLFEKARLGFADVL